MQQNNSLADGYSQLSTQGTDEGDYGSHLEYRHGLLPCNCDAAHLASYKNCMAKDEWYCDSDAATATWADCQVAVTRDCQSTAPLHSRF